MFYYFYGTINFVAKMTRYSFLYLVLLRFF